MRPAVLPIIGIVSVVLAGCGFLPIGGLGPAAPEPPRPCVARFSAERCEAMITAAAESLGVRDDEVTGIEIAPDPTPRPDGVIQTLGGARGLTMLVQVNGEVRSVLMCTGIPSGPACNDPPVLRIGSAVDGGYHDVPCAGEAPDGCASPVPAVDPAARDDAQPLRVDQRVIEVPKLGRYEVLLGTALLPNGILTNAHAELVDPWPDHVRVSSDGLWLDVRSLVDGRPGFLNIYEHGWWPGTERVEVYLVFEARHVEPGATIEIRDLVVG